MGPLTHALTSKLLGAPAVAGVWPDAPPSPRVRELTHGLPGLLVACLFGPRWVAAWCSHVALDTISHEPGEGAQGQRRWVWLP
jgi:hypothetical protein